MIKFYNRTAFWFFVLDIPYLHGKELLSAIKIKLGSLYPGNIADCNIQIRKNGCKKGSYLVFVLNKDTGKSMLPLTPLFIQNRFTGKTASVLYADKLWLDFIRIENGIIKTSVVKIKDETTLIDDVKNMCGAESEIYIYCDDKDRKTFSTLNDTLNIQFLDVNAELKKTDVYKISLFSNKSPVIKQRKIIVSCAFLFFTALFSWMFFNHKKIENEKYALLRLEQEKLQRETRETLLLYANLAELKQKYLDIINNKTASPFDISAVISECVNLQTRIHSAVFNGNFFQIEGITNNSLGILGNFENHHLVNNARLHQVHPAGNRDTFTLSGTILLKAEEADSDLPVMDKIAFYENLIDLETLFSITDIQLSPSAFGTAVNSLFAKWGCSINSFQFMNEPHKTELEISLRGNSNAFFNALYEIKTKHRMWDVHLTQIRNLYPRNLLDIVVRIRTEYVQKIPENLFLNNVQGINQFPVANISRNYFAIRPYSRTAPAASVAELPVPIVLPTIRAERVSWLEFVGSVYEEDSGRFIFLKDTRTGVIMRLGQHAHGNMRYALTQTGGIIAYINENIYEISRR
jgi:hypothetical protein